MRVRLDSRRLRLDLTLGQQDVERIAQSYEPFETAEGTDTSADRPYELQHPMAVAHEPIGFRVLSDPLPDGSTQWSRQRPSGEPPQATVL